MQTLSRCSIGLSVFLFACPTARSQAVVYTFDGDSPNDLFGISVSGAGDVNGDGSDDVIVGAFWDDNNGPNSGSARVLSGADGSILYTFDGDAPGDHYGRTVSDAGDVNADGFDDVIVGGEKDARLYSGVDGSIRYTFVGDSGDAQGVHVSSAGDVNNDGFDDVVVSCAFNDSNGENAGRARVFSGVDGSLLYTFFGGNEQDRLGESVSDAGDINRDGFDDVIVGAPYDDFGNVANCGTAHIFSGKDGNVMYILAGTVTWDRFGSGVAGAGDVNGDGFDDVIVGAPLDDNNGHASGSAFVFSGKDGNVMYTFDGDSPGDWFGISVDGTSDLNEDGFDDLIVGAWADDNNGGNSGSARVLSGVDGSVIYTLDGDSAGDEFGYTVSAAGDLDGDGFDELIVGANQDDNNGDGSGSARVFNRCGWRDPYCSPAVVNSTGQPGEILACGSGSVAANFLTLRARQLPAQQWGYFIGSRVQGFVFPVPNSQGALCLDGAIGRYTASVFNTGATDTGAAELDLANTPTPSGTIAIQPGETWNFQCWYRDSNPGPTSNFTDGLSVTFQ